MLAYSTGSAITPISHVAHRNGAKGFYPHYHIKEHGAHIWYLLD